VIGDVIEWVDPPKSPLERGTLNPEAPLKKGGWGDLEEAKPGLKICVYTVAQNGRRGAGLKSLSQLERGI
jgi:hypothetical protein